MDPRNFSIDELINRLQSWSRSRRGRIVLLAACGVMAVAIGVAPSVFRSSPAVSDSTSATEPSVSVTFPSPELGVVITVPEDTAVDPLPANAPRIGPPLTKPTTTTTTTTPPPTFPRIPAGLPVGGFPVATAPPATAAPPAPTTPPSPPDTGIAVPVG